MVKLFGICLIAVGVLSGGFYYSFLTKKRVGNLYEIQKILHLLKGEIGFSERILEDAFWDISGRIQEPFFTFFRRVSKQMQQQDDKNLEEIWREEENCFSGSGLTEEDLLLFRKLAQEMGFLDVETQLRTLTLLEEQVKVTIQQQEKKCESACRMYQSLGILGALAVFIVLI